MKQPKRSYVWMYCEQLSAKLVQCKLCGANFKYHNSTTALRSHLQTKHPEVAANDTNDVKPKIKRLPKVSYDEDDDDQSDAGEAIQRPQRKVGRPRKYPKQSYVELDDDFSDFEEVEDRKPIIKPHINGELTRNGVSKKRSIIWNFMSKVSSTECTCTLCDKVFNVKQGSTTNMMKHLEVSHREELNNVKSLQGISLTSTASSNAAPKPKKSLQLTTLKPKGTPGRKPQLPRAPDFVSSKKSLPYLVNMLVKDLHPCCTVESDSFQKLIAVLNPRISLPSQAEVKSSIAELHNRHQNLLQTEINEAPGVSLTTEVWTYRERREYLTVTGHFVTKDWELQSVVLQTVLLDTRSVSELSSNIADHLNQIMKEWRIVDKVTCIITDPTDALATAVAQVKKPHLMCIAHALNLVVETSLKELVGFENIAEKVRDVIDFVDHSVEVSQKLYKTPASNTFEIQSGRPHGTQAQGRDEIHSLRSDEYQSSRPDEFQLPRPDEFQPLRPVEFQASNLEDFQAPRSDNYQILKAVEFQALKPVEFQNERPHEFQSFKPYETSQDSRPDNYQISRYDEMQASKLIDSQVLKSDVAQPRKPTVELTLDTQLNWMSTYVMFKNYSESHDKLKVVLREINKEYILLQPQELKLVNQCLQVLRPFALAVEDMTSDVYTSLSKSLPVFEILQHMMTSRTDPESETDTDPLVALSNKLSEQLALIMRTGVRNKTNLLSFTSTLLDPRFKQIVAKDPDMLEAVEAKIQEIMDEKDPATVKLDSVNNLSIQDIDPDSLWSSFDLTVKKSVRESPVNELHRYLEESMVRRQENPLLYWKEREVLYPKLVSIVKTFLSIPATSVPPRKIFSAEEKSNMMRRTFLEEDNLDSILFLNSCQGLV